MKLKQINFKNLGVNFNSVELIPHDPQWAETFGEIKEALTADLTDFGIDKFQIEHIGSTALPIIAKPLIDVEVCVPSTDEAKEITKNFASCGYSFWTTADHGVVNVTPNSQGNVVSSMYFSTPDGGSLKSTVLFKKFMLEHLEYLKEYEMLKKSIIRNNPGIKFRGYTEMKSAFIQKMLKEARATYTEKEISELVSLKKSATAIRRELLTPALFDFR